MNISLEYYRVFYHVVKEGSITAAANYLCVSQPAVSQTIRQLEAALGVTLFLRAPKGIRLTAEGQTLFQYVERGTILSVRAVRRYRVWLRWSREKSISERVI